MAHFRELGRKGIKATADRYFNGSIPETMGWLRRRAAEHQIARGIDAQLGERIAQGEAVACSELPVILEPDDDPSYWRDKVRAGKDRGMDLPW